MNLAIKFFMVALCFCCGCRQLRGLPDRHVYEEIETAQIIGTWNITEASCKNLRAKGYHRYVEPDDHKLVFRKNGTCCVKAYMTLLWRPSKEEEKRSYVIDQEGTWELVKTLAIVGHRRRSVRAVKIVIEKRSRFSSHKLTRHLYVAKEGGKFILWRYLGDPDYVTYVDYNKE